MGVRYQPDFCAIWTFYLLMHAQLEVSDIDPLWGSYDSHNRCPRRAEIHKFGLPHNLSNYALFLVLTP